MYTAKETINKIKRQLIEWENIFANDTCDKELIYKIYKELIKLNTPALPTNKTIQLKKWAKDPNRHFSKDGQ